MDMSFCENSSAKQVETMANVTVRKDGPNLPFEDPRQPPLSVASDYHRFV